MIKKNKASWRAAAAIVLFAVFGIGVILLGFGGWDYARDTRTEETFWSSAWGTAVGGMVAVLVAVALWAADKSHAKKTSIRNRSNQAATQIHLLNQRIRRATFGRVHDKEHGYPVMDRAVEAKVDDLVAEIEAQLTWITDDALARNLRDAIRFLDTNELFERHIPGRLTFHSRAWEVTKWMDGYLENHVKNRVDEVPSMPHYDDIKKGFDEYWDLMEENAAEYEKMLQKEQEAAKSGESPNKGD